MKNKPCLLKASLILFISLLLSSSSAMATHIKGGYISYKWIQGRTYEITAGIFHDIHGVAPASSIMLSIRGIQLQTKTIALTSFTTKIIDGFSTGVALYTGKHTFSPSAFFGGVYYKLGIEVENRNTDILNISQSNNQSSYVEAEIYINSFLGINNSSVPIDTIAVVTGKVNQPLRIPVTSTDLDRDSLVYTLVVPQQGFGKQVNGYKFPEKVVVCDNCSFTINNPEGVAIWNNPLQQGGYAIAIKVEEWRKIPNSNRRIRMGYVIQEIQISIYDK